MTLRLPLLLCLFALSAAASAQCPGPGCPKSDPPASSARPAAAQEKQAAKKAKKKAAARKAEPKKAAEPKQEWGRFSAGSKNDLKKLEQEKAAKKAPQ